MDDVAYLTEAQAGATVDIMEGDSVLTREGSDRFVLRTEWHEYVPLHGYGRRLTWARSPRDLAERIDRPEDFDWRAVRWPKG